MKQKPLTNEQIADAVTDLAEERRMNVEDYILHLQSEAEAYIGKSREGLPEEIISELENARNLKKENRIAQKESRQNENIKKEIKRFKTVFPDTRSEDIPDTVWEEVTTGVPLVNAYALYLITESKENEYAGKVNEYNSSRAASKKGDGETEPAFTKEQVESMSPNEVTKNYKNIIKSIAKWKF